MKTHISHLRIGLLPENYNMTNIKFSTKGTYFVFAFSIWRLSNWGVDWECIISSIPICLCFTCHNLSYSNPSKLEVPKYSSLTFITYRHVKVPEPKGIFLLAFILLSLKRPCGILDSRIYYYVRFDIVHVSICFISGKKKQKTAYWLIETNKPIVQWNGWSEIVREAW